MSQNQEKHENVTLPIRYVSIIPVAKDFVSNIQGMPKEDDNTEDVMTEIKKTQHMIASSVISAGVMQSLSPYLFVLVETETGGAYWQYLDLAGSLSMIGFTDGKPYAEAEKIVYPNGSYMYQMKKVYLAR